MQATSKMRYKGMLKINAYLFFLQNRFMQLDELKWSIYQFFLPIAVQFLSSSTRGLRAKPVNMVDCDKTMSVQLSCLLGHNGAPSFHCQSQYCIRICCLHIHVTTIIRGNFYLLLQCISQHSGNPSCTHFSLSKISINSLHPLA